MNLLYAVAEKKKGLHYKFVAVLTAIAMDSRCSKSFMISEARDARGYPPFISRLPRLAVSGFMSPATRTLNSIQPDENGLSSYLVHVCSHIFGLYSRDGARRVLDLAEDRFLSSAFVQLGTGTAFFIAFRLLIVRYNLVSRVTSGKHSEISTPPSCYSQRACHLAFQPKADEVFDLEQLLAQPEEERSIDRLPL